MTNTQNTNKTNQTQSLNTYINKTHIISITKNKPNKKQTQQQTQTPKQ